MRSPGRTSGPCPENPRAALQDAAPGPGGKHHPALPRARLALPGHRLCAPFHLPRRSDDRGSSRPARWAAVRSLARKPAARSAATQQKTLRAAGRRARDAASPRLSRRGADTPQTALLSGRGGLLPAPHPQPSPGVTGLLPVSKEGNPAKDGKPPKDEKNEPEPRLLLPRGPRRLPKKSSNGSSKKSNENGSLPPKKSLKTSSGFRNVKPNSKGLSM